MNTTPLGKIDASGCMRQDYGDLGRLVSSIKQHGPIRPLVVDSQHHLLSGYRLFKAYQLSGLDEVPVVELDLKDPIEQVEFQVKMNTLQRDYSPSEMTAIAKALLPVEKERALARQVGGGSEIIPEGHKGEALEKVASLFNVSRPTLKRALDVVNAAESDPEHFAPIAKFMDESGNISRAHMKLKRKRMELDRVKYVVDAPLEHPAVVVGDFRTESSMIADGSVDLVFTDPRYALEFLTDYDHVAEVSRRILKPGGLCTVYCGTTSLREVLLRMTPHLDYLDTMAIRHRGDNNRNHQMHLIYGWKAIVIFCKPPLTPWWDYFPNCLIRSKKEKNLHEWQQSIDDALRVIKYFCPADGLVVDLMLGSGTTCVAAKLLGRKYLGFEIDPDTAAIARKRINEAIPLPPSAAIPDDHLSTNNNGAPNDDNVVLVAA